MPKSEVEDKRLGDYVIMPVNSDTPFKSWRRSQDPSTLVEVRYPLERHGNAGKVSNAVKTSLRDEFVDQNTQSNGRSADSSGPTSYFIPNFTTIQTPKPTVSMVGKFNRVQREQGKRKFPMVLLTIG